MPDTKNQSEELSIGQTDYNMMLVLKWAHKYGIDSNIALRILHDVSQAEELFTSVNMSKFVAEEVSRRGILCPGRDKD